MKTLKKIKSIMLNRYTKYISSIILLLTLLAITSAYNYSNNVQRDLASSLIRLHVIANSNSVQDQAVKLKVRDAVLKYMQEKSTSIKTTEEAKQIIINNMREIENIALKTLKENGFDYAATASFGNFPFPTKVYGDVILPPGMYQSFRIVLGNGAGENWWCVMFPPLCFVDASQGIVPDSSKAQLRSSLSPEEYNLVLSRSANADNDIKFKFKVVEIFQQSKIKLTARSGR